MDSAAELELPPDPGLTDAGSASADPPFMVPEIPVGNPAARPDAGTGAQGSPGGGGADAGGNSIKPTDAGGSTAPHDAAVADSAVSHPPDAAVADTGAPRPDAAATGQTCASTPAYATRDACSQCICAKCSSQIAACYASSTASLCGPVQECAQTNHCTGEPCYCGSDTICLFPAGPCIDAIQSAAGPGSGPLEVQTARDTAGSALALANDTGTCTVNNCASECGL